MNAMTNLMHEKTPAPSLYMVHDTHQRSKFHEERDIFQQVRVFMKIGVGAYIFSIQTPRILRKGCSCR